MSSKFLNKNYLGICLNIFLVFALVLVPFSLFVVRAEESSSTNYKLEGATFGAGGGTTQTSNGGDEYGILAKIGEVSTDRTNSTNYRALPGAPNVFVANVPLVQCFETTTDGSTSCTDADVAPNGMARICGGGGCYDRARFEIDVQNNPSDTLYSAQIKRTIDSTWSFVDGTTFLVESINTHDINDYLTKTAWESTANNANILGLQANTSYDIRLTALSGNYTESPASPVVNATTGIPTIQFDLDIDGIGGVATETSGPYSIDFGTLISGTPNTATDRIWLDLGSNSAAGSVVFVEDDFTGLQSTGGQTIISADNTTLDLSFLTEGYGILEYSTTQTALGPLVAETNFNNGGDVNSLVVGGISTTARQIYNTSSSPIYDGRASLSLRTKINAATPAGSYTDEITFTVIGSF